MIELKNVKIPLIISLSLRKGEIREGSKSSSTKEPIPTLPLKIEGLIGKINFDIFILSTGCYITIYNILC